MTNYEVKISYTTIDPNSGKDVKINESFILTGETLGDIEEQTFKLAEEEIGADIEINGANIVKFTELINTESKVFFKAKLRSVIYNETSKKEQKICYQILVGAETLDEAHKLIIKTYDNSIVPYEILSISETKITIVRAEIVK